MKGPKYVENNFQLLLQRRLEYNKHIKQIKNAKCNPMLEKRSLSQQQSFVKQLEQNWKSANLKREQMKYEEIVKLNTKMLIKVANAKEDQLFSQNSQKGRIDSARSSKSLHSVIKKTKERELFQENKRLKDKIENVQSSIAYNKIIENFNKHQGERDRLTRNSYQKQKKIKEMLDSLTSQSKTSLHSKNNKINQVPKLRLPKINQQGQSAKSIQQLNKLRVDGFYTAR
ncbi:unnamed protein product (macronuclear) [Paramecium tetraurelia]|uniref:Lebercilin domain-containing protein n=1 Tax=Paramecium tetraurelia TaxID=5888 RepID=A0BRK9_PARTE|nr:uncharacterized protein GSPATT00031407001 [Paramecium tetraurelia]CAK61176.1 unnamed protein product [Paramecium tetraurelia]|eukprot:XP_001428574.1 hypothetical protein (macronuclear) [Paramecium tetraurelia strain d4-2]